MQLLFAFLLSSLIPLLLCSSSVYGGAAVAKTIIVDQSGQGNYKTVQEAINSVPDQNNQWIKIHVKQGVYNEKVVINSTKEFILLEGEGYNTTIIQWGDHADLMIINITKLGTGDTASFHAKASNFVARDITFKNYYNSDGRNPLAPALAVLLNGDKMSFYRCGFIGLQDTLGDFTGRHYFKSCTIEGSVDFIFGLAQSVYENCYITSVGTSGDHPGYITAHGRDNSSDSRGYVFKNGTISGPRKMYLGRAWAPFARVLFYQTSMTDIVVSEGWDAWNAKGKEHQLTFAENGCTGAGSNTNGRVPWMKNLSEQEWNNFLSDEFIDSEGWRSQQP